FELPHRRPAEMSAVPVTGGDLPTSLIAKVRIVSRRDVQGLEGMVFEPEVEEVLFDELTYPGHVGVVDLLVEHRAAVAGIATRPTLPTARGREEELGAAPLLDRQSTVVSGEELVPGRVPGDHGSHEARRRPQDGDAVHDG